MTEAAMTETAMSEAALPGNAAAEAGRTPGALKLPVIEIFGPTIQGEGAVSGVKTMFVRTYGCDYRCAWCDSAFTWDGSAKHLAALLTPEEIIAELDRLAAGNYSWVTLSGGNPALLGAGAASLIDRLHAKGVRVSVETQGSRWQDWLLRVDALTVSPKPPSSGMTTDWASLDLLLVRAAGEGRGTLSLKIVVFDDDDYEYAAEVRRRYPEIPFYLQPGNDNVTEEGDIAPRLLAKLEWLFGKAIADPRMNEVRVLPQLHALVWHNKRGK